jgi:hypothetical protein
MEPCWMSWPGQVDNSTGLGESQVSGALHRILRSRSVLGKDSPRRGCQPSQLLADRSRSGTGPLAENQLFRESIMSSWKLPCFLRSTTAIAESKPPMFPHPLTLACECFKARCTSPGKIGRHVPACTADTSGTQSRVDNLCRGRRCGESGSSGPDAWLCRGWSGAGREPTSRDIACVHLAGRREDGQPKGRERCAHAIGGTSEAEVWRKAPWIASFREACSPAASVVLRASELLEIGSPRCSSGESRMRSASPAMTCRRFRRIAMPM